MSTLGKVMKNNVETQQVGKACMSVETRHFTVKAAGLVGGILSPCARGQVKAWSGPGQGQA
jgi:hypothetical protein